MFFVDEVFIVICYACAVVTMFNVVFVCQLSMVLEETTDCSAIKYVFFIFWVLFGESSPLFFLPWFECVILIVALSKR